MDQSICQILSQFLIDVYGQIQNNFNVDSYRHYNFTPKHLFKIFKSFIKY
jgi:hypothetical protein